MLLTRQEKPVLVVTLLYMAFFSVVALRNLNFEFVLYEVVVAVLCAWFVWKQRSVRLPLGLLWGLTIWGLLHMAGGNVRVGGGVLYSLQLIPVLLRYDQFVHAFGFGIATLVCAHLLRPNLADANRLRSRMLLFLIVLMGCGLGSLNEILEFLAVKTVKETNVGGYDNTLWDMVFNLIGAVAAAAYLAWRERRYVG